MAIVTITTYRARNGADIIEQIVAEECRAPFCLERGLLGRDRLPRGFGMLFDLRGLDAGVALTPIGMRFPIDVLFLGRGRVLGVLRDVAPGRQIPIDAMLARGAVYVLETAAGFVDARGIALDAPVDLELAA